MSASVISGSISEIAPTKVVLPTPKPPLMTIFTRDRRRRCRRRSERPDTVPDPLDQCDGQLAELVLDPQVPLGDQVGDEHPGHAERHAAGRPRARRSTSAPGTARRSGATRTAAARTARPGAACSRVSIRSPSCSGRVRPPVSMNGRTTTSSSRSARVPARCRRTAPRAGRRPAGVPGSSADPAATSPPVRSSRQVLPGLGDQRRGEQRAEPLGQQRDLVADQTEVAVAAGDHAEAAAAGDRPTPAGSRGASRS